MEKTILDKINTFTRRELREEELYVFPVRLCDNDIDRDGERFSDNALDTLKKLFVGKTGIFDHDASTSNQNARIFDTEIVTDNERVTKCGEPYKYLKASAYMVRTDENKNLIAEIDGGIKKEVSISCSAAKRMCSVCGCDKAVKSCMHVKGKSYGGKVCHTVLDSITDAYEWSFVAVPAQINAGVTKKYNYSKEEKSMEFTPIKTQAEFDAAVKSTVEAAVAEAVKKYEGWLSPDAAAALAKERDDSKAAADALSTENKSYKLSAMKMKAANEKGIPFELAEKLSGETEDEINKDADTFAKYFTAPKHQPTPRYSGEGTFTDSKSSAELELLREINNN
ncbi:MAG: DUF4355 domain-containing protein [Ruminococcus sp.]|nr:DUF4355 domain-containing protein [Ruminococcus sp.]